MIRPPLALHLRRMFTVPSIRPSRHMAAKSSSAYDELLSCTRYRFLYDEERRKHLLATRTSPL